MSKDTKPKFSITADDLKNLTPEQLLMRVILIYLLANNLVDSSLLGA